MDNDQYYFERLNAGIYIGRRHYSIMTSERLTYEDFVFISKFLGDYLLFKRGGVQDEKRLNTAVFIEQMVQSWPPSRIREKLENDPQFVNQLTKE